MIRARRRLSRLAPLLALFATACALVPNAAPEPSLHLGDLADDGDQVRRASQRLVLDGLRADAQNDSERARGLYQRALQVDSGNPYAYLALARQSAAQDEPELALEYVERAEDLLSTEVNRSPGADAHLAGLRGIALTQTGETVEGEALLERAAQSAPDVWGDGRLDADELR